MISFCRRATLIMALFTCEGMIAQGTPLKICVASSHSETPSASASRLADALSLLKLSSGRSINALALSTNSGSDLFREIQAHGCEYLIQLKRSATLQGGTDTPSSLSNEVGSGAPQDAATKGVTAPYREDEEWPVANYKLLRVGDKRPLTTGTQLFQPHYRGRARVYDLDYSVLAAKIATKIAE